MEGQAGSLLADSVDYLEAHPEQVTALETRIKQDLAKASPKQREYVEVGLGIAAVASALFLAYTGHLQEAAWIASLLSGGAVTVHGLRGHA